MTIRKRKYKNYKEYLFHQRQKLKIGLNKKIKKFMPEYFSRNVKSFKGRFKKIKVHIKGEKILCLGARLGSEVVAFREMGYIDTIGIDINPGPNNPYVIKGDFHNMKFEDDSFDTIYSNCIDHSWDIRMLSKEISRVLRPGGRLILEIDHLITESDKKRKKWIQRPSKYESVLCDNLKEIENEFREFKLIVSFESVFKVLLVTIFELTI